MGGRQLLSVGSKIHSCQASAKYLWNIWRGNFQTRESSLLSNANVFISLFSWEAKNPTWEFEFFYDLDIQRARAKGGFSTWHYVHWAIASKTNTMHTAQFLHAFPTLKKKFFLINFRRKYPVTNRMAFSAFRIFIFSLFTYFFGKLQAWITRPIHLLIKDLRRDALRFTFTKLMRIQGH